MDRNGFTLLELMIVIVILGVLAALISGNFITSLEKGRDARRKEDLGQIQKALEMYYTDVKAYPTPIPGNVGFVFGSQFSYYNGNSAVKTYMQTVPNDPITSDNYRYVSDGQSYALYACLESDQQILPYLSTSSRYGSFSCATQCFEPDGTTKTKCIWGISDAGSSP